MFARVCKTRLSLRDCAPLGYFGASAFALCVLSSPASMAQSVGTPVESNWEPAWSVVTLTAQLESNSGDAVQGLEAAPLEDSPQASKQPAEQEKTEAPNERSTGYSGSGLKLNFDALDDEDDAAATQPTPARPVETPSDTSTQKQPDTPVQAAPAEPAPPQPTAVQPAPAQPAPVNPAPSQPSPTQTTPVQPTPPTPIPQPPAPATRTDDGLNGTVISIVVAVIVLGGLAGGVVLVMRKRSANASDDVTTHVPAAELDNRPMAILRDLHGVTEKTEHTLTGDVIQIGRAEAEQGSGVQSIVVQKKTVGRRHAVIEYRNHVFWLIDQGSMNGTYVNDQRVEGEVALRPGSRIRLESAEFEFSMPSLGDGEGTLMANPHEFSETLKADSPMPMAPPPTAAGGELVKESPQNFLETMVNKEVPSQGFRPEPAPAAEPGSGRDANVDKEDSTAPSNVDEAASAVQADGTVDFDVFGDASDPSAQEADKGPGGERKQGGLIGRHMDD